MSHALAMSWGLHAGLMATRWSSTGTSSSGPAARSTAGHHLASWHQGTLAISCAVFSSKIRQRKSSRARHRAVAKVIEYLCPCAIAGPCFGASSLSALGLTL